MIKGLGTDIITIDRIQKAVERHGDTFLKKVYTPNELSYCLQHADPYPSLAARYAAKEAAVKALGTGFRDGYSWSTIEVLRDKQGKPILQFIGLKVPSGQFFLSMSHCKSHATATVIWVDSD